MHVEQRTAQQLVGAALSSLGYAVGLQASAPDDGGAFCGWRMDQKCGVLARNFNVQVNSVQ